MAEQRQRVDEFLDLYKQLEDLLEEKYRSARRRYSSVVLEYIRDEESVPVRDRLEVCREIRNLLTHSADLGGRPIVEPSLPVVESLREVLELLRRPPRAMDRAIAGPRMMTAPLDRKVLRLMEVMEKNGYSHIPVLQEGQLYGVFSAGTLFRYVLAHKGRSVTPETTLADLGPMLKLSNSPGHYAFLPADATVQQVKAVFQGVQARNRRISVVFLTEHGKPGERLLGMLTPWDVLGQEPDR